MQICAEQFTSQFLPILTPSRLPFGYFSLSPFSSNHQGTHSSTWHMKPVARFFSTLIKPNTQIKQTRHRGEARVRFYSCYYYFYNSFKNHNFSDFYLKHSMKTRFYYFPLTPFRTKTEEIKFILFLYSSKMFYFRTRIPVSPFYNTISFIKNIPYKSKRAFYNFGLPPLIQGDNPLKLWFSSFDKWWVRRGITLGDRGVAVWCLARDVDWSVPWF